MSFPVDICLYVCVYALCMYVCTYVCMYACMYVFIHLSRLIEDLVHVALEVTTSSPWLVQEPLVWSRLFYFPSCLLPLSGLCFHYLLASFCNALGCLFVALDIICAIFVGLHSFPNNNHFFVFSQLLFLQLLVRFRSSWFWVPFYGFFSWFCVSCGRPWLPTGRPLGFLGGSLWLHGGILRQFGLKGFPRVPESDTFVRKFGPPWDKMTCTLFLFRSTYHSLQDDMYTVLHSRIQIGTCDCIYPSLFLCTLATTCRWGGADCWCKLHFRLMCFQTSGICAAQALFTIQWNWGSPFEYK